MKIPKIHAWLLVLGMAAASSSYAAVFGVTNTADIGAGSLRQAITDVNSACGSGPHTIEFSIAGAGPHSIQLLTALPWLTCSGSSINGYSQPGAAVNTDAGPTSNADLRIILDGSLCDCDTGIYLGGPGTAVKGLAVHSFSLYGIGIGAAATGAFVQGNYIGTDPGGNTALGNGVGVYDNTGNGVMIGGPAAADRNLISANFGFGVRLLAAGATVQNNLIGGTRGGLSGLGNSSHAINVEASGVQILDNRMRDNGDPQIVVGDGGSDPTDVRISGNSVLSTGGNGLCLNKVSFSCAYLNLPQDDAIGPYDQDTGPNGWQNHPVISAAALSGGMLTVTGLLRTDGTSSNYFIEFFEATSSSSRDGRYLGFVSVTTNVNGETPFSHTFAFPGTVGPPISVTAVRAAAPFNTSEYSLPTLITAGATCGNTEVTNTADSGVCSLRAAITYANANCGGPQTIAFNIVGVGPHLITLATPLPTISCNDLIIDATTQSAYAANSQSNGSDNAVVKVGLNGAPITGGGRGIDIAANNVTIKGLAIYSFPWEGVFISGTGSRIQGNYIGTDPGGTAALGNGFAGVKIASGTGHFIGSDLGSTVASERNLITGNGIHGIEVEPGAAASIGGNLIGGDRNGSLSIANTLGGARISGSATNFQSNYIRGNSGPGIQVEGAATGVLITQNRIHGNVFGQPAVCLFNGSTCASGVVQDSLLVPYDTDGGPNGWQNHPVITSVIHGAGNTTVIGTLKSQPGLNYAIEFFGNSAVTGLREGENFIDSVFMTPDVNGLISFNRVIVGLHDNITATATRAAGPIDTSEYSLPVVAVLGGPVFTPSATSFTFPATAIGLSAATQTLTITNTGTGAITATGAVLSVGDFSNSTTCLAVLSAAASCTHTFTFTPTATGTRSATLTITTDAPGSPHVITLSGLGAAAGVEPTVSFAPSTVTVGNVSTLSILLTNSNAGAAIVNPLTITYPGGLVNAAVPLVNSSCGGTPSAAAGGSSVGWGTAITIAPGGSCLLSVSVTSTLAANYTVNVSAGSVVSNIGNNVLTASGTLTVGAASAPPTVALSLAPGSILVGGTSVLQIDVTNPNAVAVAGWSLTLTYPPGVVNAAVPAASASNGLCASNSNIIAAAGGNSFAWVTTGGGIGGGETCRLEVSITSASAGSYTVSVLAGAIANAVGSNAALASAALNVGLPPPTASLTPASLIFGPVSVAANSGAQLLSLTNTSSTTPLNISSASATGPFSFVAGTTCTTVVPLAVLTTCQIAVRFNPIAIGAATGTATVMTDAGNFSATLSGTGTVALVPNISFDPASVDFGTFQPGAVSTTVQVTMENTGTGALAVDGITTGPPFELELAGFMPLLPPPLAGAKASFVFACPSGAFTLNTGTACTFGVKFQSAVAGNFRGIANVVNGTLPLIVPLSAQVGARKTISVAPSTLNFGETVVNQLSAPLTFTVTSTGFDRVTLTSVDLVAGLGANTAEVVDFTLNQTCTGPAATPSSNAASATCTGTVRFRPTALGPRAADVRIRGDFEGGTRLVPVDGRGIPSPVPLLGFSATRFGFGQSGLGVGSSQSLLVSNTGQLPVTISAIYPTGDFFVQHDCPNVLPAGGRCNVLPGAAPVVPGSRFGTLVIESNAEGSPTVIPLEATGCRLFNIRDARRGGSGCTP